MTFIRVSLLCLKEAQLYRKAMIAFFLPRRWAKDYKHKKQKRSAWFQKASNRRKKAVLTF
ncbi:MAG: hypothetical protein HXY43_05710 [Fischerella sp.]|jgi:hypothetical protein|uniref:hypothetical protein n=1 Tax=Fischerella sp. TaxID=1191 RepID=UPI0017D84D80|nr:hypothetical protein [Fischerella sp.]NWF58805.1 hypothetical protein [Fischerella sp.]